MKNKILTMMFGLFIIAAFSGCGTSPPTKFITLNATPPRSRVRPYAGPPVVVGRVKLPPTLDRLSLVRRLKRNRLSINSLVWWAAPLDRLVRHTLAVDLADRLPAGAVIIPGEVKPHGPARSLAVVFEQFRVGPTGRVKLVAIWTLVDKGSGRVLGAHRTLVTAPAASIAGGDIARAISAALAKLSGAMAAKISAAKIHK